MDLMALEVSPNAQPPPVSTFVIAGLPGANIVILLDVPSELDTVLVLLMGTSSRGACVLYTLFLPGLSLLHTILHRIQHDCLHPRPAYLNAQHVGEYKSVHLDTVADQARVVCLSLIHNVGRV